MGRIVSHDPLMTAIQVHGLAAKSRHLSQPKSRCHSCHKKECRTQRLCRGPNGFPSSPESWLCPCNVKQYPPRSTLPLPNIKVSCS